MTGTLGHGSHRGGHRALLPKLRVSSAPRNGRLATPAPASGGLRFHAGSSSSGRRMESGHAHPQPRGAGRRSGSVRCDRDPGTACATPALSFLPPPPRGNTAQVNNRPLEREVLTPDSSVQKTNPHTPHCGDDPVLPAKQKTTTTAVSKQFSDGRAVGEKSSSFKSPEIYGGRN